MSTKAFSLACIALILLLVGGVGLFNRVVDPYWYFREVDIVGFNHIKIHAAGNERLVKPPLARRLNAEAIILGNSVAEIGLPPTHQGFTNNGALRSFNLALPGATWDEVYCLAMFVMRQTDVKRLIIGMWEAGAYAQEVACPPDAVLGRPDYGKLMFSRSAFAAARDTLRRQNVPAVMTPEGLWLYHRYEDEAWSDAQAAAVVALKDQLCKVGSWRDTRLDLTRLNRTPVPPQEGESLRSLIRLAKAKRIELVFVFYPMHVLLNEGHRACQGAESKWNALWRVVSIASQEGDPQRTQVWDFQSYVTLNAGPPPGSKPKRDRLWQEMMHFNEPVGNAALNAIYLGDRQYGDRVTVDNFEQLVVRREAERDRFLLENPWVRQELDLIAQQVAAKPVKPTP